MTIRVKLVILMASFIAAIVLVVSFMACHAYEDSDQIAVSGSKTTVQSVTSYVSLFFRSDEENSAFAAILPQTVAAGAASFPCPPERAQNAHPSENEPPGNRTGQTLERLAQSSPSYLAVGLGDMNGGFMEYPPIDYPGSFDPRDRPFFQAAIASSSGGAAQAKTEAMLAVADSLDEAIRVISEASGALSTQIEQSDRIASESAQRLTEAAASTTEMNATVRKVARNVSTSSQFSGETRAKA